MKIYPKKMRARFVIAIIYGAVFGVLVLACIAGAISNKVEQDRYNAELNAPATLILPSPCWTATAIAGATATVEGVPKPTPFGTKAVYCWEKKKK